MTDFDAVVREWAARKLTEVYHREIAPTVDPKIDRAAVNVYVTARMERYMDEEPYAYGCVELSARVEFAARGLPGHVESRIIEPELPELLAEIMAVAADMEKP